MLRVGRLSLLLLAVVLLAVVLQGASPLTASEASTLGPGHDEVRTLQPGERHPYRLTVARGQFLGVRIEQLGVDVALEVQVDADESVTLDSPFDRQSYESTLLEGPADVELTVASVEPGAPAGRYRLRVEVLTDPELRAAQRAWSEASRLYATQDHDAWRRALPYVQQAFEHYQRAEAPAPAARMLYAKAVLLRLLDQPRDAFENARLTRALTTRVSPRSSATQQLAGYIENEIGLALWNLSELEAARRAFQTAHDAGQRLHDSYLTAAAASNLCLMDLAGGDLIDGRDCYRRYLSTIERASASQLESAARVTLGRLAEHLGEPEEATQHYRRASELLMISGDPLRQAQTLNNLGVLKRNRGELEAAMRHYSEALRIFERLGERRWQARTASNIGYTHRILGDRLRARSHFEQARDLFEQVEDHRGQANALDNLGQLALDAVDGASASEAEALHRRALELRQAAGDRRGEALTRRRLGQALLEKGADDKALTEFENAIGLAGELGDRRTESQARRDLGTLHTRRGEYREGRRQLEAALQLTQPLTPGDREATSGATKGATNKTTYEADLRLRLARLEQADDRLDAAFRHSDEALEILEDVRAAIEGHDLRTSYSQLLHSSYDLAVELRMTANRTQSLGTQSSGHHLEALEISERGRARVLLERMQEAQLEPPVPQAPSVVRQRRELVRRLRAKTERLRDTDLDADSRERLTQEQADLLQQLDGLDADLRKRSPAYANLVRPRPMSARQIQKLVDAGTVLALYHLGDNASYVWRLTESTITAFELPPRSDIERLVLQLTRGWSELSATQRYDDFNLAVRASEMLRLRELLAGGRDNDSLVIVADGGLHLLPFSALPIDGEAALQKRRIVYLPSASVLALDRELHASRESRSAVQQGDDLGTSDAPSLAILADPTFSGALPPLPASRIEAEAIASLAGSSKTLVATGRQASRELVTSGRLRQYDWIHFATHGLIDPVNPTLSGLALASSGAGFDVTGSEATEGDGFLSLRDIYSLRLDAELVVLSGCRTALGPVVRGEGPISLARAFMYAGTRRVVASLWPVEDRVTAELMTHFYTGLWHHHLSAAEALARAQRQIATSRGSRDPYHWAGFVLVGDWR